MYDNRGKMRLLDVMIEIIARVYLMEAIRSVYIRYTISIRIRTYLRRITLSLETNRHSLAYYMLIQDSNRWSMDLYSSGCWNHDANVVSWSLWRRNLHLIYNGSLEVPGRSRGDSRRGGRSGVWCYYPVWKDVADTLRSPNWLTVCGLILVDSSRNPHSPLEFPIML